MSTARNLNNERFAVITSRPTDTPEGDYRPHFKTCGHASARCPAIKPDSGIIDASTFLEFLEQNEFFDGEIVHAAPFRCRVCHPDLCDGGTCQDILRLCSKHSAAYQREYGRASNE
jgi:hypothetical protein